MSGRRVALVATFVTVAVLAGLFTVVRWDVADKVATAVSALAERIAYSVADPYRQAEALAALASSVPDRARGHLVTALSLAEWTVCLEALAATSPDVLREIADDFLAGR